MIIKAKVFPNAGQIIIIDDDPNEILHSTRGRKIIGVGHVGTKMRLVLADSRATVSADLKDIMDWACEEVRARKAIIHAGGGFILQG